ncbi:hypothetical protein KNU62_gp52 [Gordonia phage Bakery]|uniref:Uncharacterized protein n=1 Tax=Gordonia phage Bakery TaxID=2591205 RepID=A0A514DGV9_9CAUD|nr:hypothetical protein KNU62_gp52 [Gordonia phage Bakery]QDH92837.1 hypothetical protein SEA_BAKERY_52 [Gordonia phage Bakery]
MLRNRDAERCRLIDVHVNDDPSGHDHNELPGCRNLDDGCNVHRGRRSVDGGRAHHCRRQL